MTDVVSDAFLSHRTVYLENINKEGAERIVEQLFSLQLKDDKKPVHLLINSPGGNVYDAMMIQDIIAHILTVPVHALVVGRCASAATFILLACEKRACVAHARFLIHSGVMSNISLKMDDVTPNKINLLSQEVTKGTEEIVTFYSEKLNLPAEKIRELIARGDEDFNAFLSAQEALEIGLVHEIVTGKSDVFPSQK